MRVAIYARISRVTERTTSVDRQLDACRAVCEQREWTVDAEYPDHGVSGATDPDERPQMGAMLRRLDELDGIVFYRIDRLARSTVAFADLMERCRLADVALVSVTEPMDLSTPMGRAMAEIISVFAKLEREMIRERSMDARAKLLEDGKFVGGRFPYGITTAKHPSGTGRMLVRDRGAVESLTMMADMVIGGRSATEVAQELNERGIPTSRQRGTTAKEGAPADTYWRGNAVRQVLRNPQLIGHRRLPNGRVETDDDGVPVQAWEPAMSDAKWLSLQAALDRLEGAPRAQRHDSHWLQPVTFCAVCDYAMTATVAHGNRGLKCSRPNEQRHRPAPYVRLDVLEPWVLAELHRDFGYTRLVNRVWVGGQDYSEERGSLQVAIDRLRSDRDAGLYDGPDDEHAFRTQMQGLLARRRALEGQPDEPGGWETRDTGVTLSGALRARPGAAADVLRMAGLVIRVWPALGRPIGERAAVDWADEEAAHREDYSD